MTAPCMQMLVSIGQEVSKAHSFTPSHTLTLAHLHTPHLEFCAVQLFLEAPGNTAKQLKIHYLAFLGWSGWYLKNVLNFACVSSQKFTPLLGVYLSSPSDPCNSGIIQNSPNVWSSGAHCVLGSPVRWLHSVPWQNRWKKNSRWSLGSLHGYPLVTSVNWGNPTMDTHWHRCSFPSSHQSWRPVSNMTISAFSYIIEVCPQPLPSRNKKNRQTSRDAACSTFWHNQQSYAQRNPVETVESCQVPKHSWAALQNHVPGKIMWDHRHRHMFWGPPWASQLGECDPWPLLCHAHLPGFFPTQHNDHGKKNCQMKRGTSRGWGI